MKLLCGALVGVCGFAAASMGQFVTVDFSSQFNMSRNHPYLANGGAMPYGNQTFNGVPMAMGGDANIDTLWAWTGLGLSQEVTQILHVDTNIAGARNVYSMINTFWGQGGPNSYLSVTFNATGGVSHTFQLLGNTDIRDYNNWVWTNTINNTTTVEVWNIGNGQQRLDMQKFALDSAFWNQTLTSIEIVDSGGFEFQRAIVMGLTVEVPAPATASLLALTGLVAARRRR